MAKEQIAASLSLDNERFDPTSRCPTVYLPGMHLTRQLAKIFCILSASQNLRCLLDADLSNPPEGACTH
jgi:hypothetical protein